MFSRIGDLLKQYTKFKRTVEVLCYSPVEIKGWRFFDVQTAGKVYYVEVIHKLKYSCFPGVRYCLSFAGFPPAIAAAIAAAACAGDINCRAAVADAINAVSEAVNTAIDRICRTRCRIGFHGPHHSFLMPRWGVPPWKLCWQKHIQMNCWQEGIRRSNFLEWRIQFGPCYKYRNAIPPVTH